MGKTRSFQAGLVLTILLSGGYSSSAHAILMGIETDAFPHTGCLFVRSDCLNPDPAIYETPSTGTLIAPGWVLTAAHVPPVHGPGMTFSSAFGTSGVLELYTHPGFSYGIDLALLRLADPLGEGTQLPILSSISLVTGHEGTEVLTVGYGEDETLGGSGQKRYAYSTLSAWDSSLLGPDYGTMFMTTPTILHYGDSGGGTYIDFGDGLVLAGVNSRVTNDANPDQPWMGTGNAFADLATARSWIDQVTEGAASWGTSGRAYLTSVPEPKPIWLLGLGMALFMAMQLKSRQRRRAQHIG